MAESAIKTLWANSIGTHLETRELLIWEIHQENFAHEHIVKQMTHCK